MITRIPKILEIKSEISELPKVESFLKEEFNRFNLSEKYYNKTLLCLSEAVINAIKHGNKYKKDKKVFISIWCNTTEIQIQIEDEGNGFDMKNVKNPTQKENIKKESGRGIFIISSLADSFEYNEKGNIIKIKLICCEQN